MKKLLTLMLAIVMVAGCCMGLTACGNKEKPYEGIVKKDNYADIKVGFIYLHDSNSTYDKNFMDAADAVCKELGVQKKDIVGIEESNDCYVEAAKLAKEGYDIVFADSFGHEDFMIKAAKEFPNTQFCHATGTKAHTTKRGNFHNAFASIYEGRYLAGVAAGLKLNAMLSAGTITTPKIGYVGAFPYAEVKSGYTSFFLGARSVCPSVTMEVKFTNSWFDIDKENATAIALIDNGCNLISQHADSMGAPQACIDKGNVPNVSYNLATINVNENCKDSYLIASKINWAPYFKYIINCVKEGVEIDYDWTGSIATGSVEVLALNDRVAAPGTAAVLEATKLALASGELKVFDISKFTVDGKKVESYLADVDDFGDYVGETEVIKNGVFEESKYRSAPYFALDIDGITILDK